MKRYIVPSEIEKHVKRGDVPAWLSRRARKLIKFDRLDPQLPNKDHAIKCFAKARILLDHYGTIENGSIFVIEPYGRIDDDWSNAESFAETIMCDLIITEESEHEPPHTIRLAFLPMLSMFDYLNPKVVIQPFQYDPSRTSRKPPEK